MSLPVQFWDPDTFKVLEQLLARVSTQPTTSSLRRLLDLIEDASPWLLSLTQLPITSESDKREIEAHPIVSSEGTSYHVTGELLEQTIRVSSIASISHKLAAHITYHAQQRTHEFISRSVPEIAIYLLETWTTGMLDVLHELLRVTIGPESEEGEAYAVLSDKIIDLLQRRTAVGSTEGSLVDLILSQTETLQKQLDTMAKTSHRLVGAEYDLVEYRIRCTRSHQEKLVAILATIASSGFVGRGHIVRLVKVLRKADRIDCIVSGLFGCFCSLVQPVDTIKSGDPRYETALERCRDLKFLKVVQSQINVEDWSTHRFRDAAKLAWSIYIHSAVQLDSAIGSSELGPWAVDQYSLEAISGGAFDILTQIATNIRGGHVPKEKDVAAQDTLVRLATASSGLNDDFTLRQMHSIVTSVTGRKTLLRTLRTKEEDVAFRKSQLISSSAHFSALLAFVTTVYALLPVDSAQSLWKSHLIDIVLDNQDVRPSPAAWELLQAISSGATCAQYADERLMGHKFSFDSLFVFYKDHLERIPRLYEDFKTSSRPKEYRQLPLLDVQRFLLWTPLLANVVRSSPVVRTRLLQRKPHPFQVMFEVINSEIDVEIKAVVLDAITAFCVPTDEAADNEVFAKAAEFYDKVTYPDTKTDPRSDGKTPLPVGWLNRVDIAEQELRSYPLTRAHLRFLTALLSARHWDALKVPYRAVDLVFNQFALLRERTFAQPTEQWQFLDDVLAFVEKALIRFDLTDLLTPHSHNIYDVAWELYEHPGFKVLLRILSDRDKEVFRVLSTVIDTVPNLDRSPTQNKSLLRVLRIYHRVLETQLIFTDVLLLSIDHAPTKRYNARRPADMKPLDYRLLNHLPNVIAIALLANDTDIEVSFLGVKILIALAASPIFNELDRFRGDYTRNINRLAGIIDASDDSIRIAQGFCVLLSQSETASDLAPTEAAKLERHGLAGELKEADVHSLPFVIRSSLLDLLIDGTTVDSSPNIAHFLLGFEFKGHDFTLQDPHSPSSRYSCLQIIMDQLRNDDQDISLVSVHPLLAGKTARLVYQLFSAPLTSQATMSYSAAIQSFSASQLDVLPLVCPVTSGPGAGTVHSQRHVVETTADALVAFLDFQRYIIACVALETHANEGRNAAAQVIATNLFGQDLQTGGDPIIVEILANVDLVWHENIPEAGPLEFYASFDFDQFKRDGIEWFDLESLRRALRAERLQQEKSGHVSGRAMEAEAEYLLHRLAIKNRETQINMAKGALLTAWADVLKVAIGRLFLQHIPEEQQEGLLFGLLDAIFARIEGDVSPGVLDILSESVLITMNTLQSVLLEYDGLNLPVDQLCNVLGRLVNLAARPGTTENARGNLYASVSQYLSLLTIPTYDDRVSVTASVTDLEPPSELQRKTFSIFAPRRDRFLAVLSRDALDVRDVWKTQCFALLAALVLACATDRDRLCLMPLWKDGYLSLFVRGIKDREIPLQECLTAEAGTSTMRAALLEMLNTVNLHAYWVFEAKMAFLLALATTRRGAEDLLDAGIFETLSMCSFISVQPYAEDSVEQVEALARQHRVLVCVLQLLSRVLSSLHRSPRTGAGQAIAFLDAHHESISLLLRETTQSPSLVGIEESQLIIAMLAMVNRQVGQDNRQSASNFGAFHSAVLSLAARFFDLHWAEDLEVQEKSKLEKAVLSLNHVTLAYLCVSTAGLKAGGGVPVFMNGGHPQGGANQMPNAPSLSASVQFLADIVDQIENLSTDYGQFSETLREGGQLLPEDSEKLDRLSWTEDVFSGDDTRRIAALRAQVLFSMAESLLLLSWRHLLFYANDAKEGVVRPDNLSLSLSYSTMGASRSNGQALRSLANSAAELRGVLERLTDLAVPSELRMTAERNEAYFGMLVRRLGELTAGLTGDSDPK